MIHEVPVLVRIVVHTCGTVQLIIARMNSALSYKNAATVLPQIMIYFSWELNSEDVYQGDVVFVCHEFPSTGFLTSSLTVNRLHLHMTTAKHSRNMFFDSLSTKRWNKCCEFNIDNIKRETELKEEVEASGGKEKGAGALQLHFTTESQQHKLINVKKGNIVIFVMSL